MTKKTSIKKFNKIGIDKSKFKKLDYSDRIFLDFNLQSHFGYAYRATRFQFSDALRSFVESNVRVHIYLTNNTDVKNFRQFGNDWLVNIDDYINFCDEIGYYRTDQRRVAAYFGQHIAIANLSASKEDKIEFLKTSVNEKDLLIGIRNLPQKSKNLLIDALFRIEKSKPGSKVGDPIVTPDDFVAIFTKFLTNEKVENSFFEKIPEVQINVLEELKEFLENNLDKNESFIQKWLDEEKGKYRKKRCLIFGVEYVDPIREGEIMGRKRFDVLATQSRENHILIELKSPTSEVFEIKEIQNTNRGKTTTYKLSSELARAIPQILGYKKWYENIGPEKVEELGLKEKKHVSECIIVIGQHKNNNVWKQNFEDLKDNLKVRIWTYTDLIDKMTNTIRNLKENLN